MPKLSALLLLSSILCVSCGDTKPDSVGPTQEILVLADPADWAVLEQPIRDTFEKVLLTPQAEKIFSVQHGLMADLESHKHLRRKNLLVVSPIDATHDVGEFLRSLLSDAVTARIDEGQARVTWKRDVWAKDQLLMIASGTNLDDIVANLRMEADRLYATAEDARNERVTKLIYKYGERKDVTDQLLREFGWQIRVPFGYRIIESKPDSGFVALVKEEPNRWFFVYWEDGIAPDTLTEDWVVDKRDQITRRFFDNDRIAPGEVDVFHDEFQGKLAVVLQGLWENQKQWTGGPFKSYAFVDTELERFWFVDVGVFSPNKRKETYLRQLDLIAQTFSYAMGRNEG